MKVAIGFLRYSMKQPYRFFLFGYGEAKDLKYCFIKQVNYLRNWSEYLVKFEKGIKEKEPCPKEIISDTTIEH